MKKLIFIMNPFSGQKRANRYLPEILQMFNQAGYEVMVHVTSGHGGGDTGIMEAMLSLLRGEDPGNSLGDVRTSYENHQIAFAAERSRVEGNVINLEA